MPGLTLLLKLYLHNMQYCVPCSRQIYFTFAKATVTATATETRSADAQNSSALRTAHGHSIRILIFRNDQRHSIIIIVGWLIHSPNTHTHIHRVNCRTNASEFVFYFLFAKFNIFKILSANNRPNEWPK